MVLRRRCAVVVCTTALWILGATSALSAAEARSSRGDQLWKESLALVGRGRFDEAFANAERLARERPDDSRASQLREWLSRFQDLQEQRRTLTKADYDKYVGWVKEHAEKEQWTKAVDDLFRAFLSCEDAAAFRKQAWVTDVVRKAVDHAARLREQEKWLDAIRIYASLVEIFEPDNEPYLRLKNQCRTHVILEETYTPDGAWKEAYNNVEPEMARAALQLIAERYVTEPDLRKVTVSGLERLATLAATTKLARTFPSMADGEVVSEFSRRLAVRINQARKASRVTVQKAVEMFDWLLSLNDQTLRLPRELVIVQFVEGAFEPLDEFTSMIWPSEVTQFRKDTMGEFTGVGIQISMENKTLKVISPLEDTPAYEAGIQPGDLITKVNGESTLGMTIDEAVRRITGPAGTSVTLGVTRRGHDEEIEVKMTRQVIKIRTVKGLSRKADGSWECWLDPDMKIAYLRLTGFMETTGEELQSMLATLKAQSVRGLVIDLRFNPGGLLKAAIDVCDVFLSEGQKIVSTRGRESEPSEVSASGNGIGDIPMIVLVNDISASASEIVSGALQDHHRALILGERTFGKGLVQNLEALSSGNAYLKLTTAKYYLPNGRCIQKEPGTASWGVEPDVRLKLVPKEVRKVLELRRKQDVLKGKNQKELDAAAEKEETKETPTTTTAPDGEEPDPVDEDNRPEIDPQLEAATLIMRVRLLGQEPWPSEATKVASRSGAKSSR